MTRSNDITSFTEHRKNLREHLDRINKSGRPLFITTNGEAEAVVMSAAAYDELADQIDMAGILAQIERSEADYEAGRVHDARDAVRAIAEKHGIKLSR